MLEDFRGNPRSIFNAEDPRIAPAGLTAAEVEAALFGLAMDRLIETDRGYIGHGERMPYQLTSAGVRRALQSAHQPRRPASP